MAEVRKTSDPSKMRHRVAFFERSSFVTSLFDNDRICNIGADQIGPDFLLESTESNLCVNDTPWHAGHGNQTEVLLCIKFAFYLAPLTKDMRCYEP